mmetsp:Transcript_56774/g.166150  ORF Transcript_56774/g.166150 Transcript_56774/m.166150 type:complete len:483 (-) Transcript_56774:330-1778(-)
MGHSVRELKALLTAKGVDFSHCREREELQQLLLEAEGPSSQPAPAEQSGGCPEPVLQPDAVRGLSVRELKEALAARRVDYTQCREKAELRELLQKALEQEQLRALLPDGSFARYRSDGRLCWVEFVADSDALCHRDDGTDAIVPASELEPLAEGVLPGPPAFEGSFEEARTEAFRRGGLLVAAVQDGDCAQSGTTKSEGLQNLVLASEEVAVLLGENAVFWRGRGSSLRGPHLQQLAPEGLPSLAMVLPLAVDAMKVLSRSQGTSREAVVDGFVAALEALEEHRSNAEARIVSEAAQLRWEQDEEFAASLLADQQAEEARRASLEATAEAASCPPSGITPSEAAAEEAAGIDVAKRPASGEDDDDEQQERLVKARRLLADEFLEMPAPPGGAGTARLVLRLPTGERVQRTFGAEETLACVRRWASCCALLPEAAGRDLRIPEHFDLATAFPQRTLSQDESEKTLADLGLAPSAALLLINKTS